jgi:hypothetical protein
LLGDDWRLERKTNAAAEVDSSFTSEELFINYRSIVADLHYYVQKDSGNFRCSTRLRKAASNLDKAMAYGITRSDQLGINKGLVWVMRIMTLDKADGLIPQNDEFEFHASDLYGMYNGLERVFPRLNTFRKMNARDRFELPNTNVEHAIESIYRSFGNPEVAEETLSPALSQDLKQAGEDIKDAKHLAESVPGNKSFDLTVESLRRAA